MFHTRFRLHKKVYTHRVCKAVDWMVTEALQLADPVLKLSDSIHDPAEYMYTNDDILTIIARSKDPVCTTWEIKATVEWALRFAMILRLKRKKRRAERAPTHVAS
jgi:HD superfamily phosphohydrolase